MWGNVIDTRERKEKPEKEIQKETKKEVQKDRKEKMGESANITSMLSNSTCWPVGSSCWDRVGVVGGKSGSFPRPGSLMTPPE